MIYRERDHAFIPRERNKDIFGIFIAMLLFPISSFGKLPAECPIVLYELR